MKPEERLPKASASRANSVNRTALDASPFAIAWEPITVRIPAAIKMTGIGRSKLYELIKAGEIETVKIGSSTLIKVDSLQRLLGLSPLATPDRSGSRDDGRF
ncbi:helix-turn-helix domain-containing protein [Sphingomonas sp. AP4-R1]|uniref:helix-turn-helix domain-containing protein n=1 Tax=Sphingomonas sp. AP4-R1 TaxID=2735134 RepID=UPI001493327B|nr:helix-turn-helix domain-containing protein [Sphingomonas sp. AP4-R1]